MKKRFLLFLFFHVVFSVSYGQKVAIKTNILYWAATTPNIGFEFALGRKLTLDISGNYNPWTFTDNKKLKHYLIQPELRYWLCKSFNRHFFGLHAHFAHYNVGGIEFLGMGEYRYQGNLYGAGISYGYNWIIGKRWSIEATIGVGYARLDYDKYLFKRCGRFIAHESKNYFGPTKIGVSFIYLIK